MKFRDKFSLEFAVKNSDVEKVKQILTDNDYQFNASMLLYNELHEFYIYEVNMNMCDVIRILLKQANIKHY